MGARSVILSTPPRLCMCERENVCVCVCVCTGDVGSHSRRKYPLVINSDPEPRHDTARHDRTDG